MGELWIEVGVASPEISGIAIRKERIEIPETRPVDPAAIADLNGVIINQIIG